MFHNRFIILKITSLTVAISALIAGCNSTDHQSSNDDIAIENSSDKVSINDIAHYNITIAPDLSNRINPTLYKRPVSDAEITSRITEAFYPTIVRYSLRLGKEDMRKTGQLDVLRIGFINQQTIGQKGVDVTELNFAQFDRNQADRIAYINNKYPKDKSEFVKSFSTLNDAYASKNARADIWSYFNDGIKIDVVDTSVVERPNPIENRLNRDIKCNVLVLFTDGYIEAGLNSKAHCEGNKCYYLDSKTIDNFRKAFKQSGSKDMKAFFKQEGYGIIPVDNPLLKNLNVIVMEMFDRSKDQKGGATVHPTDWDILQIFWQDWLKESGVKSVELHQTTNSAKEAVDNVNRFLRSRAI
ncbi:hypothetical protein ACFSQ3_06910 [Sphingobacterium corticis]|uniref:Uncharacterized protein n=1 Tax=Sphingobacterium corticis TaxID=1812823 RepID=A0ABW5NKX0_9SPHI